MKSLIRWVRAWLRRIFKDPVPLGHHCVPDYYGRHWFKRSDIRTHPVFGPLAQWALEQGRTLLYYDRLYVLFQALEGLKHFGCHGELNLAEVGVYRGGTSGFMLELCRQIGLPIKLHCFDTFEGHSRLDFGVEDDEVHGGSVFHNTNYNDVSVYLKNLGKAEIFQGRFQDCCNEVSNKAFHLVHLDVDLFEPTVYALDFFASRLIDGGIIIVDDYQVKSCPGIALATANFIEKHPEYFALHPLTEQILFVKRCTAALKVDMREPSAGRP